MGSFGENDPESEFISPVFTWQIIATGEQKRMERHALCRQVPLPVANAEKVGLVGVMMLQMDQLTLRRFVVKIGSSWVVVQ